MKNLQFLTEIYMQNLHKLKKLITQKNKKFLKKKRFFMLTKNDLIIQKKIISLIKKTFPDVKQFICEENFKIKDFKKINFKKPFAIIDPIDGTENFFSQNDMYGTFISINSKFSKKIDIIYIPTLKLMITRDNILSIFNRAKKNNKISLLSTKCLSNKYKGSNYRFMKFCIFFLYLLLVMLMNLYVL